MASPTPTQLSQAQTAAFTTAQALKTLQDFLQEIVTLEANNWTQTVTIGGVQVNATVSVADQATLVTNYQTLKAAVVTAFAQLP